MEGCGSLVLTSNKELSTPALPVFGLPSLTALLFYSGPQALKTPVGGCASRWMRGWEEWPSGFSLCSVAYVWDRVWRPLSLRQSAERVMRIADDWLPASLALFTVVCQWGQLGRPMHRYAPRASDHEACQVPSPGDACTQWLRSPKRASYSPLEKFIRLGTVGPGAFGPWRQTESLHRLCPGTVAVLYQRRTNDDPRSDHIVSTEMSLGACSPKPPEMVAGVFGRRIVRPASSGQRHYAEHGMRHQAEYEAHIRAVSSSVGRSAVLAWSPTILYR